MSKHSSKPSAAQKQFSTLAKKYPTPKKVQEFLRKFPYNNEENGETIRSAYQALKKKKAHCLEATFIAAAIMEQLGFEPNVISIESMDGLGHVVLIFKQNGKWGSIARSRDEGLHGRPPIFRSIRDLVWSYYDPYIDKTGKITEYQIANLNNSGADWRYSKKHLWKVEKFLVALKNIPVKSSAKRYKKLHSSYIKNGPMKPEKFWW